MYEKRSLLLVLFLLYFTTGNILSQSLTLEDIWLKGAYRPDFVYGLNWLQDSRYYTALEYNPVSKAVDIIKYSVQTGKPVSTILLGSGLSADGEILSIEGYSFSPDERMILLETEKEPIYRRSALATYYLYNLKTGKLVAISNKKLLNPTFSPDGRFLAYVRENNLFVYDIERGREVPLTRDGRKNEIINGASDWVYEEEFEFTRAFFWSPDSKRIAYYRFDEREVKEYTMQIWGELYPENYTFKYPKAGEKNSEVTIWVYNLEDSLSKPLNLKKNSDEYIPRVQWTRDADVLSVQRLNRLQNHLELIHVDVNRNESTVVYEETSDTYVEVRDDLIYLNDNKYFVITSEKNGFRHIYKVSMDGSQIYPLTSGEYEVQELAGVDEKRGILYYLSNEVSVLEKHLYAVHMDGKNKKQLTTDKGCHDISLSPDGHYFLDYYSSTSTPYQITLYKLPEKKPVRTIVDNKTLKERMTSAGFVPVEFVAFMTEDSISLNAWMIKPRNFDPAVKYPVLVSVYGGPGHQTVLNQWGGNNYLWYQMLAANGYIIMGVDNRGTGGRGVDFKKQTYGRLGKLEAEDMIQTAKYLQSLLYVDRSRLGIFGWSFGGYLSSLAITLGADYYKVAIAVAPVTSWRFYDTIYTERFLGLPDDNPAGYDENSPLTHAALLKGRYLLIHGTADDNVHLQNAIEMQRKLILAGKHADVFYYPDKNHSIYGGNTRYHLYQIMTNYLNDHL